MDKDPVCIDCAILKDENDRKKCEEITKELASGNLDMETFSNAFLGEMSGNEEEKSDKLFSVFCDDKEVEETADIKKEEHDKLTES